MVVVTKNENLWSVKSPYNPDFVRFARNKGAKWNADDKTWTFNIKSKDTKEKLKKILYELYSYTEGPVRCVELRAKCEDILVDECLRIGGHVLVSRKHRDQPVIINDDSVCLIKGSFLGRGGSMKYPSVKFTNDAEITFEISEEYFNNLSEEEKEKFTVVKKSDVDKEKLLAEKEELIKRIEEIERLLEEQ